MSDDIVKLQLIRNIKEEVKDPKTGQVLMDQNGNVAWQDKLTEDGKLVFAEGVDSMCFLSAKEIYLTYIYTKDCWAFSFYKSNMGTYYYIVEPSEEIKRKMGVV